MVFGESRAKDVYRKVVWGPYRRSFDHLPPAAELRANRLLGHVVAIVARGKRRAVAGNMARAGLAQPLSTPSRDAFATHFVDQYISWSFGRVTPENAAAYLTLEGQQHLDAALAHGRGVVVMHPHMGPAQLPLCVLGVLGYRMNQVGGGGVEGTLSETGAWATGMRHRLEEDLKARVWDGGGFLRPVLRALEGGEVVMTAMDGTGGGRELGRRLERTVLGQRMRLPVGPVYLALKSGAPLLTLHTFRDRGGPAPYRTVIGPEIPLPREARVKDALEVGADAVAQHLGRFLREHPGDWHFWDEFRPGRFLVDA